MHGNHEKKNCDTGSNINIRNRSRTKSETKIGVQQKRHLLEIVKLGHLRPSRRKDRGLWACEKIRPETRMADETKASSTFWRLQKPAFSSRSYGIPLEFWLRSHEVSAEQNRFPILILETGSPETKINIGAFKNLRFQVRPMASHSSFG